MKFLLKINIFDNKIDPLSHEIGKKFELLKSYLPNNTSEIVSSAKDAYTKIIIDGDYSNVVFREFGLASEKLMEKLPMTKSREYVKVMLKQLYNRVVEEKVFVIII